MRLPSIDDSQVEIHQTQIAVSENGYFWMESEAPAAESGYGPVKAGPYMGEFPGRIRYYEPLLEVPDLFQKFRDLPLDQESIRNFANEYGWIGAREFVDIPSGKYQNEFVNITGPRWRVVQLRSWEDEIQDMIIADRLWKLAKQKDNYALRDYFSWHPEQDDVWVGFQLDGRQMHGVEKGGNWRPLLGGWYGWLAGTLINPNAHNTRVAREKKDLVFPAMSVVTHIVNEKISKSCGPVLQVDYRGRYSGSYGAKDLLGCIWLQFYLNLLGQLKLKLCTECGQAINVTDSRSSRRLHKLCSANARQRRWRAKKRAGTKPVTDSDISLA